MEAKRLLKISKYLSKHLRHEPDRLGITLEVGGWVGVDDLIKASRRHQFLFTRAELEVVVSSNDKQRFSFNGDKTKIRANQGHSVEVDLQLTPVIPPEILYHGTGEKTVAAIKKSGLKKMSRHHVHLSADQETAIKVGARHGRPFVFQVKAKAMEQVGFEFFCSDNGVWLVDRVPPEFLTV